MATTTPKDISVRIVVKDDGTVVLKQFGGQVEKQAAKSSRAFNELNKVTDDLNKRLGTLRFVATDTARFFLPLSAAAAALLAPLYGLYKSVEVTTQLKEALAGVAAVSGATKDQMAALEVQARQLGESTQYTAAQAASAQEYLAKAGFQVNEILGATPATLQLAAAGELDLARAADLASNILTAFGGQAKDLGHYVDVIASTASNANTSVEQLAAAMVYAAANAHSFGISVETVSAAIAVLSNSGVQASQAGTGLRQVLIKLANPTGRLKEVMGGLDGFLKVMDKVAHSNLTASQALHAFGARAGGAFNILRRGIVQLESFATALHHVDGAAKSIAEERLDQLKGDITKLGSALAELGNKIGESGLYQNLRSLTQSLTEFARGSTAAAIANNLVPALGRLVKLLALLAAARFGGRALTALGSGIGAAVSGFTVLNAALVGAQVQAIATRKVISLLGTGMKAIGGLAGLAIIAAAGIYELIKASDHLAQAQNKAAQAQAALNDEQKQNKQLSQHALIQAREANQELADALQERLNTYQRAFRIQVPQATIDRLKGQLQNTQDQVARLDKQIETVFPDWEKFAMGGKDAAKGLDTASNGAEQLAAKLKQLKNASDRLKAGEKLALSDAQAFVTAQSAILKAQFDARAPTLDSATRLEERKALDDKIERLQRDLYARETDIAKRAADERKGLVNALINDETKAAKLRLGIEQDLARQEIDIERKKRDKIKDQLVSSLNDQAKLEQQAADYEKIAAGLEQKIRQAGETQAQLVSDALGKALTASTPKEAVAAWQKYVELGGDARRAVLGIRDAEDEVKRQAEQAKEKAADLAKQMQQAQKDVSQTEESLRKLTAKKDLDTKVVVDDSQFEAFLKKLAKGAEFHVSVISDAGGHQAAVDNQGNKVPLPGMASGGPVPGGYGGGDRIPALLEPGEYVVRKEAASAVGLYLLEYLNNWMRPPPLRLAPGGPVGNIPAPGAGTRDVVDLNLNVGGRHVARLSGERQAVDAMVRVLRGLQSTVPGGV
jgi:TP901 family phage tail tape measure protein